MATILKDGTVRPILLTCAVLLFMAFDAFQAEADIRAVQRWIQKEFDLSTITKEEQHEELAWIMKAAKPFRGMEIKVISEKLPTHEYESKNLSKAFYEITGIKVRHELFKKDEVLHNFNIQQNAPLNSYDIWICDSDLIGTLVRGDTVVPLSDFMAQEGRKVTLPSLDLDDITGKSFSTGPDGKLYQLPDQLSANLYWFRYDWFIRDDFKEKFAEKYGYELGVPINWSAYEDIADFFSNYIIKINGLRIYGHNDYGKSGPSLGRRFSNAWLSMAGVGDKGIPNGKPVDEWGIRLEGCRPVGASVERGGAVNGPAAGYALRKYLEWGNKYAPKGALKMNLKDASAYLIQGRVAQQIFFDTARLPDILNSNPIVTPEGIPKWRLAPSPHGAYWENGMKTGYQHCGAWTLFKNTPLKRRKAAWLYAQFCLAKSTSLTKSHRGLAPVRISDINHESFTKRASKLGGLVEFYRSPERAAWTPNGINIPDYPGMFKLWGKHIEKSLTGSTSAKSAMEALARDMDKVLMELSNRAPQGSCAPKLNKVMGRAYWLKEPGSPKKKVSERLQGQTVNYDCLLQSWH